MRAKLPIFLVAIAILIMACGQPVIGCTPS